MESGTPPAYGLWSLVVVNSIVFIVFAFSFARPRTPRDWRSFGAFSGFLVALFAEMYGYPLTIYLLSGWLGARFPGIDFLSHDAGHLLEVMFGWRANPHFGPFHLLSALFIGGGFWLLSSAWSVLYAAQRSGTLAQTGAYARVRHPQYVAFVLIMFGFLLQWPTVLTLVMFPILVVMYLRLALAEERESAAVFGDPWERYARRTPRFVPKLGATMPQDCGKASAKPHGHTVEKGPGIESPSATALPCAGGAAAPGPSPDSAKGQPHNHGTLNMNP